MHYLLPFLIAGLVIAHIAFLHVEGSSTPLGLDNKYDSLGFYPYFVIKDVFGLINLLIIFFYLVFFDPNLLGHPDNYIQANALVTPAHIVPEWYFLPFYAILRSIPDKLGGVACMGAAIAILLLLPFIITPKTQSPGFKPVYAFCFFVFCAVVLALGWLGAQPVEVPYIALGQIATVLYFSLLLIIMPVIVKLEDISINR